MKPDSINMSKQTLSKSQKRKLKLLEKGAQSVGGNLQLAVRNNAQQQKPTAGSASQRRRQRRRRNRVSTGTGNPQNLYVESLMYPESTIGAKVPDDVTYPSCTFQLEYAGTLSTGATAGDSVAIMCQPTIGTGTGNNGRPMNTFNGTTAGSLSSIVNIDWAARATVVAAYEYVRPVSAALTVFFIGPSTADGGIMVGGCVQNSTQAGAQPATFSGWEQQPEMSEWAARDGIRVVWKPADSSTFRYMLPNSDPTATVNIPQLLVAITGLPVASSYFRFTFTANFEALPATETYSILSPSLSEYSEQALRKAFSWARQTGNNVMNLVEGAGPYISAARKGYAAYRALTGSAFGVANGGLPLLRQSRLESSERETGGSATATNDDVNRNKSELDMDSAIRLSSLEKEISSLAEMVRFLMNRVVVGDFPGKVERPPDSPVQPRGV